MRVFITVYHVRNGPVPVDFLASYWLSAAIAGLWGNARFTSCPSSSRRALFISKVCESRRELKLICILACSLGFYGITFERSIFTKIAWSQCSAEPVHIASWPPCCAVAENVVMDTQTDTQTNPRCACAPRVNNNKQPQATKPCHLSYTMSHNNQTWYTVKNTTTYL